MCGYNFSLIFHLFFTDFTQYYFFKCHAHISLMFKNALLFNQTKPDEFAQYIFSEINLFSKKIEKMLSLENIWWGGYQNNIFQSCKMQQRMLLQTTYILLCAVLYAAWSIGMWYFKSKNAIYDEIFMVLWIPQIPSKIRTLSKKV